jgi:hypothetical protein
MKTEEVVSFVTISSVFIGEEEFIPHPKPFIGFYTLWLYLGRYQPKTYHQRPTLRPCDPNFFYNLPLGFLYFVYWPVRPILIFCTSQSLRGVRD